MILTFHFVIISDLFSFKFILILLLKTIFNINCKSDGSSQFNFCQRTFFDKFACRIKNLSPKYEVFISKSNFLEQLLLRLIRCFFYFKLIDNYKNKYIVWFHYFQLFSVNLDVFVQKFNFVIFYHVCIFLTADLWLINGSKLWGEKDMPQ